MTLTPMRRNASVWATSMKPVPTTPTLMSARTLDHLLAGEAHVQPGQSEHDDAVQHLLERFAGLQGQQQPVEHREDESADDGARVAARAAEDRRPADHRGRDRRQE